MKKTKKLDIEKNFSTDEKLEILNNWLQTPQYSYLGQDYGRPKTSDKAEILAKCKSDLPMLNTAEIIGMMNKLYLSE